MPILRHGVNLGLLCETKQVGPRQRFYRYGVSASCPDIVAFPSPTQDYLLISSCNKGVDRLQCRDIIEYLPRLASHVSASQSINQSIYMQFLQLIPSIFINQWSYVPSSDVGEKKRETFKAHSAHLLSDDNMSVSAVFRSSASLRAPFKRTIAHSLVSG